MTTTTRGDLADAGQVMLGLPCVRAVDLLDERPDGVLLEVTVGPNLERVPPRILRIAGRHDIGLSPARSGVRGCPTHYTVVFR